MISDEQIEELNDTDPNELLTKNEEIDAIQIYDSTM